MAWNPSAWRQLTGTIVARGVSDEKQHLIEP
jgi:hypothetical protein